MTWRVRHLWTRHWPIVVLIAAPLVLLAPIVFAGRVLYWGVPVLQFYPWQQLAAESYRAGQTPLWNSLVGSGAPLAANLQTGAFYPLNFLYLLLPTEYAMGYTAALHVILAGLFMYAYLRAIRLSLLAALIGALSFQMCGFLIARFAFFSVTATFPWLAAWLWRAEKLVVSGQRSAVSGQRSAVSNPTGTLRSQQSAVRGQGPARGDRPFMIGQVCGLALVIGLGALAGHAQTAVYGLVMVSAYFLWRILTARRPVIRSLLLFASAGLLGLGFAAIQLLPAAELARESQRAGGLEYIMVMTHSYWPPRLLTLLSPDFFGNPAQNNFWGYDNYWENAAYIGLMPLLLALWAIGRWLRTRHSTIQSWERSALIPFFALAAILSLVLAFGWFTPIYPFLYEHVPGFGLFQGPARWLVVTEVALCVLAGIGMQLWLDRGISRRAARRWLVIGFTLSLMGLAFSFVLRGDIATVVLATLRLGALLIVTALLFRSNIQSPRSQVLAVVIVALDLITAHFALNPALPPDIYHASNPTANALKADGAIGRMFYFNEDETAIKFGAYLAHDKKFDGYGPNTLDYWLGEREALLPNAGMIDGVPTANNFDSLIVGRYQALLDEVNRLPLAEALPVLSRMHVGYLISPRVLNLPILYRTPDVTIYRNPAVLPRAWIAPLNADLNQVSETVPDSRVDSLTDSGNTVTIRAASPTAGQLILADVWYPGWQAYVDGHPVEMQLANEAFRAVAFPMGAHTIEFRYEPRSFSLGALLSLISGVIILIGLAGAASIGLKRRLA